MTGLIETMRVWQGTLPLWPWHRARLHASAATLSLPLESAEVDRHVRQALASAPREAVLRLLATPEGVQAEVRALPPSPAPYRVGLSPEPVSSAAPEVRHKTTARGLYVRAAEWAAARGLADALLVNEHGHVTETSIASVIVVHGGQRWTPPVRSGLLPGVMRQVLLDAGVVHERVCTLDDLRRAEALWLCNAVRGVWRAELA